MGLAVNDPKKIGKRLSPTPVKSLNKILNLFNNNNHAYDRVTRALCLRCRLSTGATIAQENASNAVPVVLLSAITLEPAA